MNTLLFRFTFIPKTGTGQPQKGVIFQCADRCVISLIQPSISYEFMVQRTSKSEGQYTRPRHSPLHLGDVFGNIKSLWRLNVSNFVGDFRRKKEARPPGAPRSSDQALGASLLSEQAGSLSKPCSRNQRSRTDGRKQRPSHGTHTILISNVNFRLLIR